MSSFRDLLVAEFSKYKVLAEWQLNALERHNQLLIRWNRVINLTRILDLENMVRFHYCESLYLGLRLPEGPLAIADIGSGAGFPGIPLAILRPECSVDLIESDQRKAAFLREASAGLTNVQVVAARAEGLTKRYDWLVSRGVPLRLLQKLDLAPRMAVFDTGVGGFDLPWGRQRRLRFVSRGTVSTENTNAET